MKGGKWNMYSNRISGGSLGWKGKGALMPEFEKVAFELEVSTIGSPKWAE
jgi:NIMA-interacting peptidyl-prolyl cis-trans isomerase 4